MVCNGNNIQAVIPGLTHSLPRSHFTIGIDCMDMKIRLVEGIAANLRQNDFRARHGLVVEFYRGLRDDRSLDDLRRNRRKAKNK